MPDTRMLLIEAVRRALDATGVDAGFEVVVERSARPEFGDWSTPAALGLARALRRAPAAIAAELVAHLEAAQVPRVRSWTVTPPGYVNAHLDDRAWATAVLAAATDLEITGSVDLPKPVAGKTLVEHTATNPNKAAHIGHLRNACIGDTVARVLRRTGHAVEVNNYIDDTGVQVADVVVGIRELGIEPMPGEPFDQYCSRVYIAVSARYETDAELLERRRAVLREIEEGGNQTAVYVKALARRIVNAHLATMRRFDIAYDLLTWESDIIGLGFWRQAFELLRESGAIVLAESGKLAGCWVMPADAAEDDADDDSKVLVKSDGIATYTAKDIAYQLWKFGLLGRDFHYVPWESDPTLMTTSILRHPDAPAADFGHAQRVINVIDARQAYPQRVVQRALRRLHHEREADSSIHLSYEVVALTPAAAAELGVEIEAGRESVALSGRRGIEVRADDLLDRAIARLSANARDAATATLVAAGAVRYYLLKFSLNQIIAFDFDEALRVTGDTGVYLQYAHARAAGILRKVSDEGGSVEIPSELHPAERELLHGIEAYGRALTETAHALAPSLLTTYAFALASAFSDFYEHTPAIVREEDHSVRQFRRALVAATRATLADALHTLGMGAPDQV
ncbi:MAG TPA: arginine--tRNA ligase [Candidatus Saccharimonadales bacterium]|nr:arginine--tRNA ligase [Candidatus Saccharimonadales bacterium]